MNDIAKKIKPYFRLLRVGNLGFLVILLFVMEYWVATPLLQRALFSEQMPWWILTVLIISVVCIAAGGYVINDYFDVKIDRINRPDDLIVTRVISRDAAMLMFQVLTAVGIVCGGVVSWWARSWTLLFIYIVIPGLLWFYSASYKRMFLVGNLIVAFVSAIVPLLVAIVNADHLRHLYGETLAYTPIVGELYIWLSGFAAFAFLMTLAREMECRTLPIVWGEKWTKIIVTALVVGIMALIDYIGWAVLPFPAAWNTLTCRYLVFGLKVPLVCVLVLLWFAKSPREFRTVQQVLKFVMFMGVLFSYVIATNL